MKALACAGADTAPHTDFSGLVVSSYTTALTTSHHRMPDATAATADRQPRETLFADVHVDALREHLKSVLRHQDVCDVRFCWTATMIKAPVLQ